MRRTLPLLAAAALATTATLAPTLTATATGAADAEGTPGQPGEHNAITDVPGIQVGQIQADTAPFLTGTTVVYTPEMSVASVDQRGGAPATKETDLLSPLNSNPGVNAIQLGGSSMYGLSATNGIIRWLEDRGEGVPLGSAGVAPIVPAADIYDLNRGGDPKARTSPEWGYLAAEQAVDGPVRQGSVGGGTGARGGGLRSGLGTSSVYLGDGIWVGAIVIVNPAGSPVDPTDCSLHAVRYGLGEEFAGYQTPTEQECSSQASRNAQDGDEESLNTTIAVVATNAPLEKAAAQRMSGNAHDGMARAIYPIHTLADGDTVFAISTGEGEPLQINDPADSGQLNQIFNAGSVSLSRAIGKAVLSAESHDGRLSYCDTYPSACENMPQLAQWRSAGTAPDITHSEFTRATRALRQTPVPARPSKDSLSADTGQAVLPATGGDPGSGTSAGAGAGASWAPSGALGMSIAGLVLVGAVALARRRPTAAVAH
ncbi:P1 family peptidase [Ornithinicoccus hortensis]|uniref:L-aminopeptidase/D-esterase-like protein n=1 Tax=Ornithinicoccus hortensis TaxID=82346 RepID=A0A542YSB3_9MICO|nr:P1 family peptidase [Ornithinicoccus hortensis]TQL50957.1 L-aminopeptidase/D-esterase-like protein [Ornithinicoccus hortensis]